MKGSKLKGLINEIYMSTNHEEQIYIKGTIKVSKGLEIGGGIDYKGHEHIFQLKNQSASELW